MDGNTKKVFLFSVCVPDIDLANEVSKQPISFFHCDTSPYVFSVCQLDVLLFDHSIVHGRVDFLMP